MKKTVIRLDGQIINIGEWDYRIEELLEDDREKPIRFTAHGNPAAFEQKKVGEVIHNPLPEGAVITEEEVTVRADGGLAVATDHASLRRAEYPPLVDQLDAIWKGGEHMEAMKTRVLAIKDKHPKGVRL